MANDAASAFTTVAATQKVYLPIVLRGLVLLQGFESQFNGSAAGWEAHSGTWWIESNQWYTSQGLYEAWASASYAENFDNFVYEVMMRRGGCTICANNILIRGTPHPLASDGLWYSDYLFEYVTDGAFSVWKRTGGTPIALQDWTESPAINPGSAWNLLKVVANGPSLYFYVNGTLVWAGTDYSLSAGRVGFSFWRDDSYGNQLWVDWAKLTEATNMVVTDVVSPEQQLRNDQANRHGGGVPEYVTPSD